MPLSKEPDFAFVWSDSRYIKRVGSIPWRDLEKGIELSLKNATRLASDADLLLANKRMASAGNPLCNDMGGDRKGRSSLETLEEP